MQSISEFLRYHTLNNVGTVGSIKTIPIDATVGETLDTLVKRKINGAPLVDEDGDAYGTIDMLDLVAYAAKKLDPKLSGVRDVSEKQVGEFLEKYPIVYLADISGRNAWHSIPQQKSLKKAIRFLGNPNVHRIWLTNSEGYPCGVLTQCQLIEFLLHRGGDKLNPITSQRIQEVFPESSRLVSVSMEESLMDAFRKMYLSHVSGMPVVDANGSLVGNISVTDLKYLDFSDKVKALRDLFSPIGDFFSKLPRMQIVAVNKLDTIRDAMEGVVRHRVHRIYVLDEQSKLHSVLSLSDLIAQFNLW